MPGLFSLAFFSLAWLLTLGSAPSAPDSAAVSSWRSFFTWNSSSRFDSISPVALLSVPRGAMVLADGHLGRLLLLSEAGDLVEQLQGPSEAVVEWTSLVQRDGLSFLALDGPQGRIHQFDLQGNYLGLALDLNQMAENEGIGPVEAFAMVVDKGGNVLVSDQLGDRLLVFSSGWTLTGVWGESGSEEGQFLNPGSLAAGNGNILVADRGNSRWVLLDEFGEVLGVLPSTLEPGPVVSTGTGFAAVSGAEVHFFDGDLIGHKSVSLPHTPTCAKAVYGSGAIVFLGRDLYVGEGCSGSVYVLRGTRERDP